VLKDDCSGQNASRVDSISRVARPSLSLRAPHYVHLGCPVVEFETGIEGERIGHQAGVREGHEASRPGSGKGTDLSVPL